jgi:5-formyltetrahydrofolate cyclo-ligase
MTYDKSFLRKKFLLQRKKRYSSIKKFNFKLIFNLIKKNFNDKKITIAGYYPSDNEVNILKFLEESSQKKFKIALPLVKSKKKCVLKFGILKNHFM